MPLAPNSAMTMLPWNLMGGMPRITLPDGRKVSQPHAEWYLNQLRWRFLLDSWEGGEAYRMATYGFDIHGMPVRNLIRHKREYPSSYDQTYSPQTGRPPGTDPYNQATDDDYELRRARTPVPGFLAEVVETHLSKILKREVSREGPPEIEAWWEDVDGRGATIDQWMSETIAPLVLVLGQLDIVMDHPPAPKDKDIISMADYREHGLGAVRASYILPENMVWWMLDARGRYEECLIREVQDNQEVRWRYWNRERWALYSVDGKRYEAYRQGGLQPDSEQSSGDTHPFGAVPIVRLFDRRRPRSRNVGLPRYEIVAELQREYYNRDSELILSDTTHAHPLLQMPEDYCNPDQSIPIGPNWVLPMKKNIGQGGTSYQGTEVIEFPHAGADSLRTNLYDIRDKVDRHAGLTKPAGAQGTDGNTVAQSGLSKRLDASTGNDLLGKISAMLGRVEGEIADLFWFVHGDGKADQAKREATEVVWPTEFDLASAAEIADLTTKFQMIISLAGNAPEVEKRLIERLLQQALAGLPDEEYRLMAEEVESVLAGKAAAVRLGQGPEPEAPGESERVGPGDTPNTAAMKQATLLDPLSRNPDELLG